MPGKSARVSLEASIHALMIALATLGRIMGGQRIAWAYSGSSVECGLQ